MRNFGSLKYYEGGYDSYLLSKNIIREKFKIKKGGELEAELAGWEIKVGPREAVDIPAYYKQVLV